MKKFVAELIGTFMLVFIGTGAVSYTHLDVYKRQGVRFIQVCFLRINNLYF